MSVINIGEFIKLLDMEVRKSYAEIPWKAMAGFRDKIAHSYHTLKMEDVFTTVKDEFPVIYIKLQEIISVNTIKDTDSANMKIF